MINLARAHLAAPLIEWHDHLSLGIPALDEQHRELADLVNLLASKVRDGRVGARRVRQLLPVLNRLHRHTRTHFLFEEQLMASVGYCDAGLHSREHLMLLGELKSVTARFVKGSESLDHTTLLALKEWLIAHIVGSDREFALFYRDRLALEPIGK